MKFILNSILVLLVFSCSTNKDIVYVQNLDYISNYNYDYKEYLLKVDDILKIDVRTSDVEFSMIFNQNPTNQNYSNTRESILYNGYLIDAEGNINFPSIGKIKVKGLTILQARNLIKKLIIDSGQLKETTVDLKLINSHFTILGEVKNPGRYEFLKNNLNIFEAIGMAGDLTITGKRTNVKLIREDESSRKIYEIDLTKTEFLDKNYQIFSGDILIINPNKTRVKNAGLIGNSGTLLSLLSFILSSIIVISNT